MRNIKNLTKILAITTSTFLTLASPVYAGEVLLPDAVAANGRYITVDGTIIPIPNEYQARVTQRDDAPAYNTDVCGSTNSTANK